jgi:hypothetical protein
MALIVPRLFFEYYPDAVESFAYHIGGFIKEQKGSRESKSIIIPILFSWLHHTLLAEMLALSG